MFAIKEQRYKLYSEIYISSLVTLGIPTELIIFSIRHAVKKVFFLDFTPVSYKFPSV